MNICVLYILYSGYGYTSPACYTEYGLITPQEVVHTQHLDSGWNLWIAPASYVRRYYSRRRFVRHVHYHRYYRRYHHRRHSHRSSHYKHHRHHRSSKWHGKTRKHRKHRKKRHSRHSRKRHKRSRH